MSPPDPTAAIARIPLGHLPTPLEPMERLSAHLGGPALYIKRDDCTGLGLGGNKVRKLEFLLAAAEAKRADTLVTAGVIQSNHIRQTAAAAARRGLACHLVLMEGRVGMASPEYLAGGNLLLDRLFGATLHRHPWTGDRNGAIAALMARLAAEGRKPAFIPYGGSSALGALGYVRAAHELLAQARALGIGFDAIVHASGSAGTQAGLAAGLALLAPEVALIGIDIDAEPGRVRADVTRLAGAGYGQPTDAMLEAVGLAARLEGLVLDPVYSGKGLAGLIALVRAGRFARDARLCFIHTGGAPALFAYRDLFAP
ncbi:MAG: D-cysteine desulfhydrase family protein [Alphaproteobacteria bacterium]|nr:D-cysteine desulfhydrase family protein [Alphaproteobacteria bacterium]